MNNNNNNQNRERDNSRTRRVEIPVYHYNAPTYQTSGSPGSGQYRSYNQQPEQNYYSNSNYPPQSQTYNDYNNNNRFNANGGQYDYDPPSQQQPPPQSSHYYSRSPPRDEFANQRYTPGSYYQAPLNRRHESPQPASHHQLPNDHQATKTETTKKFIPINVINSGGVKMGNTIDSATSSGNPSTTAGSNNTPNSRQGSSTTSHQTAAAQSQPRPNVPSAREKLDIIHAELNSIRDEIEQFSGKSKKDKVYLRLEELLTRCLLKLDEIERSDDEVTQLRKRLINMTHELSDLLDKKVVETNDNVHSSSDHQT